MTKNKSNHASSVINWVARILGLVILVLFLMILIGETTTAIKDEGFGFDIESLYIIIPIAMALAAYILSWWHKMMGGSLLILVSIILGILPSVSAKQHQTPWSLSDAFQGWLLLGLPFLIVGILFLISVYLDSKTAA